MTIIMLTMAKLNEFRKISTEFLLSKNLLFFSATTLRKGGE